MAIEGEHDVIHLMHAITSLDPNSDNPELSWNVSMWNRDLSTLKLNDDDDNEIPKPASFPTDAEILARKTELETKWDAGTYNSLQELMAEYE